jgi:hypothetical protein
VPATSTYIYVFFIMKHCVWIWGHGVLGLPGDPEGAGCFEISVTAE